MRHAVQLRLLPQLLLALSMLPALTAPSPVTGQEILRTHHRGRVDLKALVTRLASMLAAHAHAVGPQQMWAPASEAMTRGAPAMKRLRLPQAPPLPLGGQEETGGQVLVRVPLESLISDALANKEEHFGKNVVVTPQRLFLALLCLAQQTTAFASQLPEPARSAGGSNSDIQQLAGLLVAVESPASGPNARCSSTSRVQVVLLRRRTGTQRPLSSS